MFLTETLTLQLSAKNTLFLVDAVGGGRLPVQKRYVTLSGADCGRDTDVKMAKFSYS